MKQKNVPQLPRTNTTPNSLSGIFTDGSLGLGYETRLIADGRIHTQAPPRTLDTPHVTFVSVLMQRRLCIG
jgi:hypothetical protein